jgi:hypothetical protein
VDGTDRKLCPVVDLCVSGTELKVHVTPVICNFLVLGYCRGCMMSYVPLQGDWGPFGKKLSYFEI